MNQNEINAEKLIILLDEFKNNSKTLRERKFDRSLEDDLYGVKVFNQVLVFLRELKEKQFPLLGIRDFKSEYKEGYSYNITNGLMSLGQFGSQVANDGFYITLNKNSNNVNKCSVINFCMNDVERKKVINYIETCLKSFNQVVINRRGDYELEIIVRDGKSEIRYNDLKEIVKIIVSCLEEGNKNGSENEHLKYINMLLSNNT